MPAIRLSDFDTWRPGYGLASVRVVRAGTDNLAAIYTDEALTVPAENPQTLLERIVDGVSYGKWADTIYTGEVVELQINAVDQTGMIRPALTTLSGQDASQAVAMVEGGSREHSLADHLARRIDVRDFGAFVAVGDAGASAATNTTTIVIALGVAGAAGGGYVELPAGTYDINPFSIPGGVKLRGQGKTATTLQSTQAAVIVTIGGTGAGFVDLCLDGVSQVVGSTGIYAVAKDGIVFDNVLVKRFETGLHMRGGEDATWRGLTVSDCVEGAKLHGDMDAGNSSGGEALRNIRWMGAIELCSDTGAEIKRIDAACELVDLSNVRFDTNTGKAVAIIGARNITVHEPLFIDNTVNIAIEDGSPADTENTVVGVAIEGGVIEGGEINLSGTLDGVVFRRVDLRGTAIDITAPKNNVLAVDCREDADVTLSGTTTAWVRQRSTNKGASAGVTTGDTPTKAWALTLQPGERAYLVGKVVGRQRNGTRHGFFHIVVAAQRPGSTLAYDTQTGNFTAGDIVTGQTSGATARIVADSDDGATGTLTLQDIEGVFEDNELITDPDGGSATVNGALVAANAELVGTVQTIHRVVPNASLAYDGQSANFTVGLVITGATSKATGKIASDSDGGSSGTLQLTDVAGFFQDNETITDTSSGSASVNGSLSNVKWDATFVANGPEIELRVTGDTGQTVEWIVDVEVTR